MSSITRTWIDFYKEVQAIASDIGSKYRNNIQGRNALITFMDVNNWFDTEYRVENDSVYVASMSVIYSRLKLWLSAYGLTRNEKESLLLDTYSDRFPETCGRYRNYCNSNSGVNKDAAWNVLDFLLATIDKELGSYSQGEINRLLEAANQELTLTEMDFLVGLLQWRYKGKAITDWDYRFYSRQMVKQENGAYEIQQFSYLAYRIFNKESWEERDLVQKAAENKIYADLWLFAALHFVCALRKTDIARLPIPSLPYSPDELRRRILHGEFTGQEARAISQEVVFRSKMIGMKPNKTRRNRSVSNLKVFFPESIMEPLGTIMALSLSYRREGDPFVSSKALLPQIRRFFGDDVANILGNKGFMSRRANKAYLQGLESITNDVVGNPKGYMIAALARSHKGGIGNLPETTDIYLKDAKFSGYKPEFILREMFERGVFGFIPAMLIEKMSGEEYRKLDVHSQTELIGQLGLSAEQLENLTEKVMNSKHRIRNLVDKVTRGCDDQEINRILQTIAAGAAPSKQDEFLCLMAAAGYRCRHPERSGCLGCGYEIYTKSATQLLITEYLRLLEKQRTSEMNEKNRIVAILENGILPAIAQILESIPQLYPDAEMKPIYQIVERGANGSGCA